MSSVSRFLSDERRGLRLADKGGRATAMPPNAERPPPMHLTAASAKVDANWLATPSHGLFLRVLAFPVDAVDRFLIRSVASLLARPLLELAAVCVVVVTGCHRHCRYEPGLRYRVSQYTIRCAIESSTTLQNAPKLYLLDIQAKTRFK